MNNTAKITLRAVPLTRTHMIKAKTVILWSCLPFVALLADSVKAQAEFGRGFFVYQTRSATATSVQGDPSTARQPDHWEIWLYPKGRAIPSPLSRRGSWGSIHGATIASVQRQLKNGQEIELKYNTFSGVKEMYSTYFNYAGPIAVYASPGSSASSSESSPPAQDLERLRDQLLEVTHRIAEMREAYKATTGISGEDQDEQTRSEYLQNMKEAEKRAVKLGEALNGNVAMSTETLARQIQQLQEVANKTAFRSPEATSSLGSLSLRFESTSNSQLIGRIEVNDRSCFQIHQAARTAFEKLGTHPFFDGFSGSGSEDFIVTGIVDGVTIRVRVNGGSGRRRIEIKTDIDFQAEQGDAVVRKVAAALKAQL